MWPLGPVHLASLHLPSALLGRELEPQAQPCANQARSDPPCTECPEQPGAGAHVQSTTHEEQPLQAAAG